MRNVRSGLVVLLACFAVEATAATAVVGPSGEKFFTKQISGEGYEGSIFLPEKWSVDPDRRVILPEDADFTGCQIKFDVNQSLPFKQGLEAGIQQDKKSADRDYESMASRSGNVEAVWVRYVDKSGTRIGKAYIARPADPNAGFVVWKLEAPDAHKAADCERLFKAIAGSSSIKPK